MKFTIKTPVPGNYLDIMKAFDRDLFEHLKPKGAKMEIVAFTGSETGDKVHIKFTAPFKAEWVSEIVDHGQDEAKAYFIDQGVQLPWPFKFWKHAHVVKKINTNESVIEDQIEYKTSNVILDAIIRPAVYLGFYPRRAQYKNYFG